VRQVTLMKDEVRRLSELVQSFLHYGKPIEIRTASTDVKQLVDGVLAISESKMKSQGIEVIEDADSVPTVLSLDADKVRTCFMNVVANAVQAMPDGGTIKVTFAHLDGRMVIKFTDTGGGIDPDIAAKIFEPFFTTKREGIGLGLFLSKAIVEGHGGTIDIGPNQPGPGTTVTFTFPQTMEKST
jgi:signal transduction histidine kinase